MKSAQRLTYLSKKMYTLKDLESKSLKELKEIGYQLAKLPTGDRRCRQNWIDAIAEALEVFPTAEVEPTESAIEEVLEVPPGVKLSDKFLATYPPYFGEVQYKAEVTGQLNLLEPIADSEPPDPDDFDSLAAFDKAMTRWVDSDLIESQLNEPLAESLPEALDCPSCGAGHGLFINRDRLDRFVINCLHCAYSRSKNYPGAIRTLAQESAAFYSKGDRSVCAARPPPQIPASNVLTQFTQ